jgi:hypothetical protein
MSWDYRRRLLVASLRLDVARAVPMDGDLNSIVTYGTYLYPLHLPRIRVPLAFSGSELIPKQ